MVWFEYFESKSMSVLQAFFADYIDKESFHVDKWIKCDLLVACYVTIS